MRQHSHLEEVNPATQPDFLPSGGILRPADCGQPLGLKSPLLLLVEGTNDIQFLRLISHMLHEDCPGLPDLMVMEQEGKLLSIPIGGSDLRYWFARLAVFGCPEFHLFDREIAPVMRVRHAAARLINQRHGCRAYVTKKRSLENYLHPAAILECRSIQVVFSDEDDVADLVAHECFSQGEPKLPWSALPARYRKRLRYRAKRWLNTSAVQRMTVARLAERDPPGEIRSWLTVIAELAAPRA